MHFAGVDIPRRVIEAQDEGRLVIFAGAGVSKPKPSRLPDFKELARRIAGDKFSPSRAEPLDRFLGRLPESVPVHRLAAEIIGDADSKPCHLHRSLLDLFAAPDAVRIVTTNFDAHFTTVANAISPGGVPVFYAPALPLGRDFHGIVYLHGGIRGEDRLDDRTLVLTDEDFGKAYLTEGWATRFLLDLFAHNTVLFVGYGHGDPTVSYLARGLPPDTARFALVQDGPGDHWAHLNISTICYPVSRCHTALRPVLQKWTEFRTMDALRHKRKVREIVQAIESGGGTEDLEIQDYIAAVLGNPRRMHFVTEEAGQLDFLFWLEKRAMLKPLFTRGTECSDMTRSLAYWFSSHFVCDHIDEALTLIQRQGGQLHHVLWESIAMELARKTRPRGPALASWTNLLLSQVYPNPGLGWLEHILRSCGTEEDAEAAIVLFDHLVRVKHVMTASYSLGLRGDEAVGRSVNWDLHIVGDANQLNDAWQSVFQPNLDVFGAVLAPIITSNLLRADTLLRGVGRVHDGWDWASAECPAVHESGSGYGDDGGSLIITAARHILEWALASNAPLGKELIRAWFDSRAPILKRLAIHGMAEDPQLDADTKLSWMLQKELLYAVPFKPEVFHLLRRAYPGASGQARVRLLRAVVAGPVRRHGSEETNDGIVYDLLSSLHSADPECSLVNTQLAVIQRKHPDFEPRPYADRNFWTGSGPLREDGCCETVEELLAQAPSDVSARLAAMAGDDRLHGIYSEQLLQTIGEAVAESHYWSLELADLLCESSCWKHDVWRAVLSGWERTKKGAGRWKEILRIAQRLAEVPELVELVARFLHDAMVKSANKLPYRCLSTAENTMHRLWIATKDSYLPEDEPQRDWLIQAMGSAPWNIAEFFVYACHTRYSASKQKNGIPHQYRILFEEQIHGISHAEAMARVRLAGMTYFFKALDSTWARDSLLPLLDWSRDEIGAAQAWQGYLNSGYYDEDLLHYYVATFPRVTHYLGVTREIFAAHLAGIAVYGIGNPLEEGWLSRFLQSVQPEDRNWWTRSISQEIKSLDQAAAEALWEKWLGEYWGQRVAGLMTPLDDEEWRSMLSWIPSAGPGFPDAVSAVLTGNAPSLRGTGLYKELLTSGRAQEHSEACAFLAEHLLKNEQQPFYDGDRVMELVKALSANGAPRTVLSRICNILVELRCPGAEDLASGLDL